MLFTPLQNCAMEGREVKVYKTVPWKGGVKVYKNGATEGGEIKAVPWKGHGRREVKVQKVQNCAMEGKVFIHTNLTNIQHCALSSRRTFFPTIDFSLPKSIYLQQSALVVQNIHVEINAP